MRLYLSSYQLGHAPEHFVDLVRGRGRGLARSLRGLELCDPIADCRRLYGEVRYDGLGILDRPVVPHLNSPDHPETTVLTAVARHYAAMHQPFYALRDGEALVVDGQRTYTVG